MVIVQSCTPHGWQDEAEACAFFTSNVLALKQDYVSVLLHHLNVWITFVARKSLRPIVV